MLFKTLVPSRRPFPLKPFVLKIRDGYLVGLGMDPEVGSPCTSCVEKWLRTRNVWVERANVGDLMVRRDLLADLIAENSAHVFYEISNDGTSQRLDGVVFPHPECDCQRKNFIAPTEWDKKANFAFSPILQIRCARYGTPKGNLWLSSAMGESPITGKRFTVFGTGNEREESRFRAVENWMKESASSDLDHRMRSGDPASYDVFQTGAPGIMSQFMPSASSFHGFGVGVDKDAAILDGVVEIAKRRTLKQYAASMKNPMLIVGSNNFLRERLPFFLLQQYDIHLLFYPNSSLSWVVGIAAFARLKVLDKPTFVFSADAEIGEAINKAIQKLLEVCRPADWAGDGIEEDDRSSMMMNEPSENASKLNLWWTHWIYRCPKISLKDVMHLEAYPRSLDRWKDFFRDGLGPVQIVEMNHDWMPKGIRSLVRLQMPSDLNTYQNVRGIGTISTMSDTFL